MSGSGSSEVLRWYEGNASAVAARHESLDPSKVHHWWLDQLPKTPAVILDVGAGSGRDAAWLAAQNHDVIAVEPVLRQIVALVVSMTLLVPEENRRRHLAWQSVAILMQDLFGVPTTQTIEEIAICVVTWAGAVANTSIDEKGEINVHLPILPVL